VKLEGLITQYAPSPALPHCDARGANPILPAASSELESARRSESKINVRGRWQRTPTEEDVIRKRLKKEVQNTFSPFPPQQDLSFLLLLLPPPPRQQEPRPDRDRIPTACGCPSEDPAGELAAGQKLGARRREDILRKQVCYLARRKRSRSRLLRLLSKSLAESPREAERC